ncbi:MAG: MmcQ/YjbR family DNA-binding protein [Flavobacteriales bacterium]
MNIEEFREYCLKKPFVTESFPFDQSTLVFKVGGKMFALCDIDSFASVNLKSEPGRAEELRAQYFGIKPGYHMNKKHWNSVTVNSDVDTQLLLQLIDESYEIVFNGLPKKERSKLLNGGDQP